MSVASSASLFSPSGRSSSSNSPRPGSRSSFSSPASAAPFPSDVWSYQSLNAHLTSMEPETLQRILKEETSQLTGEFYLDCQRLFRAFKLPSHPALVLVSNSKTGKDEGKDHKETAPQKPLSASKASKSAANSSVSGSSASSSVSASASASGSGSIDASDRPANLTFANWQFDTLSFLILCSVLPHCRSAQSLTFLNCSLTAQNLVLLAETLPFTTVQKLAIDYNPLTQLQPSVQHIWGHLLQSNPSLQSLSLRGNKLGGAPLAHLLKSVAFHKSLLYIDLSHNCITDTQTPFMVDCLALNTTLLGLNLSRNYLSTRSNPLLLSLFKPKSIDSKDQAKLEKAQGYRITNVKNKFYRDANQNLKYVMLCYNALSEADCEEWREVMWEYSATAQQEWREWEKENGAPAGASAAAKKASAASGSAAAAAAGVPSLGPFASLASKEWLSQAPALDVRKELVRGILAEKEVKFTGQWHKVELVDLSGNPGCREAAAANTSASIELVKRVRAELVKKYIRMDTEGVLPLAQVEAELHRSQTPDSASDQSLGIIGPSLAKGFLSGLSEELVQELGLLEECNVKLFDDNASFTLESPRPQ